MGNEYMICWEDLDGKKNWEVISGEDAMQEFVSNLCSSGLNEEEDITVFNMEDGF